MATWYLSLTEQCSSGLASNYVLAWPDNLVGGNDAVKLAFFTAGTETDLWLVGRGTFTVTATSTTAPGPVDKTLTNNDAAIPNGVTSFFQACCANYLPLVPFYVSNKYTEDLTTSDILSGDTNSPFVVNQYVYNNIEYTVGGIALQSGILVGNGLCTTSYGQLPSGSLVISSCNDVGTPGQVPWNASTTVSYYNSLPNIKWEYSGGTDCFGNNINAYTIFGDRLAPNTIISTNYGGCITIPDCAVPFTGTPTSSVITSGTSFVSCATCTATTNPSETWFFEAEPCCGGPSINVSVNLPGNSVGSPIPLFGFVFQGNDDLCYKIKEQIDPTVTSITPVVWYSGSEDNCIACVLENPCPPTPTPTRTPTPTPTFTGYTYYVQECCEPFTVVQVTSTIDLFWNVGQFYGLENGSGPETLFGAYEIVNPTSFSVSYPWNGGTDEQCGPWGDCTEAQSECEYSPCAVSPTPTATPTQTPTITPSITPTITDTPTSTPTPTITDTPTSTPTPTITDTPTNTPTPTVTSTPTPTPTITDTPTSTPTPTITDTPTNTPTPTITDTPTSTPTPTITDTPTNTPTPTITDTPTNTPTPTITDTPTNTPTPTITQTPDASVSPTPTLTETPTPTITDTPTNTPTPTVTDTPTQTPTPTVTDTPGASVTPTNTETPTNTPTPTVTDTPANTPTPTVTDTPTSTPTPTVTDTPTQTPTPTVTETPDPSVSPTPTETPTPTVTETPTNTPTVTPTETPTSTPTPTVTPTDEPFDIYSFQACCEDSNKFRYNNVPGTLIVGQVFFITGGTGFEGCAEVIPYEVTGPIYFGGGVSFIEQDNCLDVDCPPCPTPTPTMTPSSTSSGECNCLSYNVSNIYDLVDFVYYTDCFNVNQSVAVAPLTTISICACEGTVFGGDGILITSTGDCPPVSETPQPTPSVTPTITVSPSSGWNLCDEDFCFVTYDPSLDLYNGTYSVSGSSLYNGRYVFSGDVMGVIYYNSTTQQWCLSDTIGGPCLFGGPTPSTSTCPDLWDVVFSTGICDTTTSTTSPCDVFDFVAYFDCDVPVTPTPTPTTSPTSTPTPTPTPSVDICTSVVGDITISAFTTTTTTIPSTTTTTTICYEPLSGDVTFTLVETIFICPGDNYQFTNCVTSEVVYIEPSNLFVGVDMITGFTYSMNINGENGCYTYNGATTVSPNGSVTGDIILFSNCDECEFVTPSATPTSTVTPTPTVTPTVSVSQTITPTPTESLSVTSTPTVTPTGTEIIVVSPSPTPTLTQTPTTTPLPAFLDGSSCYNFYLSHANNSSGVVCSTVQTPTGFINYYRSDCDYQTVFVDGDPTGCTVYINDGVTAVGNGILSDGCRYWATDASGIVISGPNVCSGASGCCTA